MFQAVYSIVHQGRNISVLGWIESFQKSFSGVDDEVSDGSLSFVGDDIDKFFSELVAIEVIYSKTAFYCAWYFDCFSHCYHALFY